MKHTAHCPVVLVAALLSAVAAAEGLPAPKAREVTTDLGLAMLPDEKVEWMREAKIGMFIHWGLYAGLAKGEWEMEKSGIPIGAYRALAFPESGTNWFDAAKFDPEKWMAVAQSMGARYTCLTAQHHDGYALFDSAYPTAFTSMQTHGRDFVREYVEAARKAGMKVGLYKTLINWRHPGYYDVTGTNCAPNAFGYTTASWHRDDAREMKEELYAQTRELLLNYGRIDYLFWDGGWLAQKGKDSDAAYFWESGRWRDESGAWPVGEKWGMRDAATGLPLGLMGMVRALQPDIVCNLRSGWCGDFTCEEGPRDVKGPIRRGLVEKCMTVTPAWGYTDEKPRRLVPISRLRRICADCLVRDMNFLLNVAPDRHGEIPADVAAHVARFGQWIKANAQAVYGTRGGPWDPVEGQYGFTRKGDTVYVWLLGGYKGTTLALPTVGDGLRAVRVAALAGGRDLRFSQAGGVVTIEELPDATDALPVVVAVEYAHDSTRRDMIDYSHQTQL
ncbi:MAG: alpha-L-fucosidase [Kiritimatiellae bacterium]|nr:alpha-L-fucosidase [Kiritimatiellia bacterium]